MICKTHWEVSHKLDYIVYSQEEPILVEMYLPTLSHYQLYQKCLWYKYKHWRPVALNFL